MKKRPFTLEEVLQSATYGSQLPTREYVLTFVRDLVRHAVPLVEAAVRTFTTAGEDALTNILLLPLYMLYPGAAREPDHNGHVDIALQQLPFAHIAMTGEAKIIGPKGFEWYAEGLTKLVSKYNGGRDDIALMVAFCRKPGMYKLLDEYRRQLEEEKTADFESGLELASLGLDDLRGVFATKHDCAGSPLTVVHVWLNVRYETDEQAFAAARVRQDARRASKATKEAKKKKGRG